jgi:hypothetical protein
LYCSCLCFIHWPSIVLFMFMLHSLTLLLYCPCLRFIHWSCYCTVHVYASFIDPAIVLFMFMRHSLTLLLYCSCLCFIHWPRYCTVHVYASFIFVIVCGLFEWKLTCADLFSCLSISVLSLEIQFNEFDGLDPANRFNPTSFVCQSQATIWFATPYVMDFLCSIIWG